MAGGVLLILGMAAEADGVDLLGARGLPGVAEEQPVVRALDLLAVELRLAQNALNTITGEFGADDLLGVIFSSFCIGK